MARVGPPLDRADERPEVFAMSPHPDGSTASRCGPTPSGFPVADRPWSVETHGIDVVPDGDRHGKPSDLLWLWSAANLGVIGIVYGAVVATLGLDLLQAVAVTVVGTAGSFLLVGVLGIAGQRGGEPMLALSRRLFGASGNVGPSLVSWVSLVGWETVTAIVAADALLAIVPSLTHGPAGRWSAVVALAVTTGLSLAVGRLGHATIIVVQRAVAWIFGIATLALVGDLAFRADWARAAARHPAPFGAVVAAASVVIASAGLSWVNVSADYTRYLPRGARGRAIVGWTTLGASTPLVVLVVLGYVLSSPTSTLASSPNPVEALRSGFPGWAVVPYLSVAVVGLLAQMVMGLYSSGLNLLVLGIRVRRSRTVLIDALVVLSVGGWFMVAPHDFLGSFVSFVELLACPLATWAAVFLVDMLFGGSRDEPRTAWPAGGSWAVGTAVGLLFTASPLFTGPLARGIFVGSSLGYFAGFLVSAALFAAVRAGTVVRRGREATTTRRSVSGELPPR